MRVSCCSAHISAPNFETFEGTDPRHVDTGVALDRSPSKTVFGWAHGSGTVLDVVVKDGPHAGAEGRMCWHCVQTDV